mgnify:CR=1 FL=1
MNIKRGRSKSKKKVSVSSNDIIVHTVDYNKITVDECYMIHNKLKKEFPNNEVITLPCSSYIETMDKKSLIKYLKQIIEKLEGEPKDE